MFLLKPSNWKFGATSPISGAKSKAIAELKLYKKINDIRKYFLSIGKDENYEESLKMLSSIKNEINDFFDNVIVNDEDIIIKKNRLELLNMLCKTFDNYFNFSKIDA